MKTQRLIVGITGGSGAILGIRLLRALRDTPVETHLIITPSARLTIQQETSWTVAGVQALADRTYQPGDLGAAIASGSFDTLGMVVIPCSIKSLSAIANSYTSGLLTRAADVTLKEGRPLILVAREAPLHAGHIRLMRLAAEAGAVIFPPVPAFYAQPHSVDALVDNIVGRVLRRVGIENDLYMRWEGLNGGEDSRPAVPASPGSPAASSLWELPMMILATSSADGLPYAAPVQFAADEARQNLYFFSTPGSQHSQDILANPRAAAWLQPPGSNWQASQGLQIRGRVSSIPAGEAWERGWQCYLVKFPFTDDQPDRFTGSILYSLQPDRVQWTGSGHEIDHKEDGTKP